MNLRWTDAGRAALASSDHTGAAAVKLTHFAIGDGQGPGGAADDSRAALRNERHRAAIEGTEPTNGRIAFRADFAPDASYGVTEAGVFGTAGDPAGPLTLLLYWSDDGAEASKAAANTALTFAVVVEFQSAAADVAVTVGGNIVFGATEPATEAAFGSTRYATGEETGAGVSGERSVTPKGLKGGVLQLLGALVAGGAGDGTIYQLKGDANGALVVEERTQDGDSKAQIEVNAAAIVALGDRVAAVEGKTDDAATNRKGIVELATDGEAKTGTDARRAVTPKAMRAATAANIASLLGSVPEEGKQYVLEGLAQGGLKLALSSLLLFSMSVTLRSRLHEWYDGENDTYETARIERETVDSGDTLALAEGYWVVAAWVDPTPDPSWVAAYPRTRPYVVQIPGLQFQVEQGTGGRGNFSQPSPHWLVGTFRAAAGGAAVSPAITGNDSVYSGERVEQIGEWVERGVVELKAAAIQIVG